MPIKQQIRSYSQTLFEEKKTILPSSDSTISATSRSSCSLGETTPEEDGITTSTATSSVPSLAAPKDVVSDNYR